MEVIGLIICFTPGWLAHSMLKRRFHLDDQNRSARMINLVFGIIFCGLSGYFLIPQVMPKFTSKYDSPYEDAPCVQGGGWGC